MLLLPVFSSNVSALFAGADALDQSIQAQQYALMDAEKLRAQSYGDLADMARTDISWSDSFQHEIVFSPETETPEGFKEKIATISIYKAGEVFERYKLKVPFSDTSGTSGVPVGTVIIWPAEGEPLTGKWLECNGQSTIGYPQLAALVGAQVPDYRGMFLRGYGSTTVDHGVYGEVLHSTGNLGEVQGDAIRNIVGEIDEYEIGQGHTGQSGAFKFSIGPSPGTTGNAHRNLVITFDASLVVPTAEENRPVNKAVRYLIKAV
jgi:hypothetical protein